MNERAPYLGDSQPETFEGICYTCKEPGIVSLMGARGGRNIWARNRPVCTPCWESGYAVEYFSPFHTESRLLITASRRLVLVARQLVASNHPKAE